MFFFIETHVSCNFYSNQEIFQLYFLVFQQKSHQFFRVVNQILHTITILSQITKLVSQDTLTTRRCVSFRLTSLQKEKVHWGDIILNVILVKHYDKLYLLHNSDAFILTIRANEQQDNSVNMSLYILEEIPSL